MNPQSTYNPQGTANSALQGNAGDTNRLQMTASPQQTVSGPALNTSGKPIATLSSSNNSSSNPYAAELAASQAGLAQAESLGKQLAALLAQEANKPVAANLNLNAINAQAQQQATASVNPLYTQKLNEYLQNEAAAKQEEEAYNKLAIQSAQSNLQNTLAQNQIKQQTTQQSEAQTLGEVNRQQAAYQQNQGNAFDQKRIALNASLGAGGLAGSGMGQQQLWNAENLRNVEEAQQKGTFQYNKNVATLEANSTFAQLAQSGQYAQTQEGQQEQKANFDLNNYLRQAAYNENIERQQLASWQQQAQFNNAWNIEAQMISNQIASLPAAQRAVTTQAYAPYLSRMDVPSLPDVGVPTPQAM